MKITFLSGYCFGPGDDALPGDHREVIDPHGRALISRGKAKAFVEAHPDPDPDPESKKGK